MLNEYILHFLSDYDYSFLTLLEPKSNENAKEPHSREIFRIRYSIYFIVQGAPGKNCPQ